MLLRDALHAVIDDGIEEVRLVYQNPDDKQKLDGALKGFEECRDKQPVEIAVLLNQARQRTTRARRDRAADYWYWRYREAQIEWVANVLSAILQNEGNPVIIPPTVRGLLKAADIVGVKDDYS